MAQKNRRAQEQLTFPELEWLPVIQTGKPEQLTAVAAAEPPLDLGTGARRSRKKSTTVLQLPEGKRVRPMHGTLAESTMPETAEVPVPLADSMASTPLADRHIAAPAAPLQPAKRSTLASIAYAAVLAASLVVAMAAVFGADQFYQTQQAERQAITLQKASLEAENQAKAVALFVRYNELVMQPNTVPARSTKKEARYWKEGLAVSLLESLFNLTSELKEWEPVVSWALERHGRYIREQRLACKTYSVDFIKLAEKVLAAEASSLCR